MKWTVLAAAIILLTVHGAGQPDWRAVQGAELSDSEMRIEGTGQLIREYEGFSPENITFTSRGTGRVALKQDYRPFLTVKLEEDAVIAGGERLEAGEPRRIRLSMDWSGRTANLTVKGPPRTTSVDFTREADGLDRLRAYRNEDEGELGITGMQENKPANISKLERSSPAPGTGQDEKKADDRTAEEPSGVLNELIGALGRFF